MLAVAVISGVVGGLEVIDRGEISGKQRVIPRRCSEIRLQFKRPGRAGRDDCIRHANRVRVVRNIGEPTDIVDDRAERGRQGRLGRGGLEVAGLERKGVKAGIEGAGNNRGRGVRLNKDLAGQYRIHGNSLRRKPCRQRVDIVLGGSELLADLRGGQPLVKARRGGILLISQKLAKRGLHLR